MLHRTGPFDQDSLIESLKGYLPVNGKDDRDVFEVEYTDDQKEMVMIANFIWINNQWVFIDIRER